MTQNFDVEIAAAEARLNGLTSRMEQIRQSFMSTTVEFVRPLFWEQTESLVKREAELTKKLGVEKLAQLKSEVKALQDNTESIAAQFLNEDRLWWHLKPSEQMYSYYGNRPPDGLDKAVRLIAGRVAPILEKYGYLSANLSEHGIWREWDASGNHHLPNSRPCYPYGLDWSDTMKALIQEYQRLHQDATRQANDVAKLKKAKEQSEAEDLWKRA